MRYPVNFFQNLAKICSELKEELNKFPKKLLQAKKAEIFPYNEVNDLELDVFIEVCCQNVCLLTVYHKISPNSNFSISKRFLELFMNILFAERDDFTTNYVEKLNNLPINKIRDNLSQFESISHFIQTIYTPFIKEYNPNLQKKHGITYTPDFIIQTMIESIDSILIKHFKSPIGISSKDLILYDPATGSLSFEIGLISYVYNKFKSESEEKGIKFEDWILQSFSNSFLGNELNPPAYFLGKFLLLDILYKERLDSNNIEEKFSVFFKSALSPDILKEIKHKIKDTNKPLVIFGNPPYAVSSSNKDPWIYELMREYSVKEPNLTRLYDDYVKFLRLGQWLLEQQKRGILAFITNRKYLDGKIFYGMRKSMLKSFDLIYIVDLFGDIRNIKDPDKKIDTNIFGIQTGVCIGFFVKNNDKKSSNLARVFYLGIKGSLEQIKSQLSTPFEKFPFIELYPQSPKFYFVPVELDKELKEIWNNQCIPISDCFQKTSRAMISSRDHFMIHVDKISLKENITSLKNRNYKQLRSKGRMKQKFDEILENKEVISSFDFRKMESSIIPLNYRPFDVRHGIFYTINRKCGKSIILDYLNKSGIIFQLKKERKGNELKETSSGYAFNFVQSIQHPPFNHILFTKGVVDSGLFGYSTSKVAPLWIDGKSNISPNFTTMLQNIVPQTDPIQISGYIYAILNCDQFTKKFEPILIHEFPRVLVPLNSIFFESMSILGRKLMQLHVFEFDSEQWERYQNFTKKLTKIPESFELKSWKYDLEKNELQLISEDKKDFFILSCSKREWDYKIGSIKLIDHWLKARRFKKLGRKLEIFELKQLISLLFVIKENFNLKSEIDDVLLRYYGKFQ